ncbi:tyrosine-type recombinase/integrase [Sporosarcina newyorkensis]|uniref:tyrosine-type recombinase/integrase n=1 Tax=Sporosarcina newyorkensis TaxID=759851 RepID=UPI003D003E97
MASYKDMGNGKFKLYVELGYDAKGKRIRRTKTVAATGPRQAAKLLSAYEVEVYNSVHIDPAKLSFGEFVDRWRENYATTNLSASTREVYEDILKHVTPYFESKYIKDISTFHIVQYFTKEKKEGRGSLEKKYNVLMSLFKYATEWKVISENPMLEVEKPKMPKTKLEFYDKDEISQLFKEIHSLESRHQLMIKLTVVGGLRRGELLGIAYDQVDFAKNQIHIKRSLQYTKSEGLKLKGTKTEDERTVSFPESLMKELHRYYIRQLNARMEVGKLWKGFKDIHEEEVMLFVCNEYGVPFQPNAVTRFWGRFMDRTELKRIRFQDLRHSSASLILSEGVNMKVLQKRLGHRNIKTTLNIYSHITEKDDEKASDVFNDLL